jgi:hypothetical protein
MNIMTKHHQINWTRFLSLTLLLFMASCDATESSEFQKTIEEKIHSTLDDLSRNSNPTVEEIRKLSQLEYHVETFPLKSEPEVINKKLNLLGRERWDCFSSFGRPGREPDMPEMIVLCKRTPETVLRYVPKSFLGR